MKKKRECEQKKDDESKCLKRKTKSKPMCGI